MGTEVEIHSDRIAELSGKAGKAGNRNLPVICDRADYFRSLVQ
jgi:tRNA G46 methylase TrmB